MDNIKKLKKYLLENGRNKSYNELAQDFDVKDKTGHISGERVRGIWRRLKVSRDPSTEKQMPKVVDENGKNIKTESSGTGPVDAVCKAIDTVLSFVSKLTEFSVHSVTEGRDAWGEVTIRVENEN